MVSVSCRQSLLTLRDVTFDHVLFSALQCSARSRVLYRAAQVVPEEGISTSNEGEQKLLNILEDLIAH